MCLYNERSEVRKLLRKGQWQLMYKVYRVDLRGVRPRYNYDRGYLDLKTNEIKSDSRARGVSLRNGHEINRGIHVYRGNQHVWMGWSNNKRPYRRVIHTNKEIDLFKTLPEAWQGRINTAHELLVRVWCHKDDLLGASSGQAVYKKVYIHEDDYAKLVAKYLPDCDVVEV